MYAFQSCFPIAWEISQELFLIIRFYSDANKLAYICC